MGSSSRGASRGYSYSSQAAGSASRGGSMGGYGRSSSGYSSEAYGQSGDSDSSEDDGATATGNSTARRGTSRSTGFVGSGGMDGADLANLTANSQSSSATTPSQLAAAEALDRAVTSASNTSEKALNVSSSHGTSLREIAQAILDGNATNLDAEALDSLADTLDRFAGAVKRTKENVERAKEAQEVHHEELLRKSYELGRQANGGRHTGRYRSGLYNFEEAASSGGGGGGGGIARTSSRAMSSRY
ncbi:uncharacterized protein JCM6883_006374 [Sporobolomyces salmoneus]|uniref:uncharacterized protein n=1 Tax=Sporobolomyces salmoneus TaxID=183962 RepID=UPI00317CF042